jgi:hypothetical protein
MESIFSVGFVVMLTLLGKSLLWDNDASDHQLRIYTGDLIVPPVQQAVIVATQAIRPATESTIDNSGQLPRSISLSWH